jgi:hypothetical protein
MALARNSNGTTLGSLELGSFVDQEIQKLHWRLGRVDLVH